MERGISASLDFVLLHPPAIQLGGTERQALGSGSATQRNHWLVLDEEQQIIRQFPGNPLSRQASLQLQYLGIGPGSQLPHDQSATHEPIARRLARRARSAAIRLLMSIRPSRPRRPSSWCTGMHTSINRTVAKE